MDSITVGVHVVVEVSPRLGFGVLKPNVAGLLNVQGARVKEPTHFFLLDEKISDSDPVEADHPLSRYRAVLEIIQTLKHAAAFLDIEESLLVFVSDGKFDIPLQYNANDFQSLSMDDAASIRKLLAGGLHEEQCKAIMADAVIGMTRHLPESRRFSFLLTHLGDLRKRYEAGFNLFASGFSYQKVRDEVESAKVEFTGKIHKVLSDVQNQLLGIPVATIVVATQMKYAKEIGYEFWLNSAVLVGCWVFAFLMIFVLTNQGHTLRVLRIEIDRQKRQIEKEYKSIYPSFADTFLFLNRRVCMQRLVLWTINGFVLLGLLLAHVVYLKVTIPAAIWMVSEAPFLGRFF